MIIPILVLLWKRFALPHFFKVMPRVKLFDEKDVLNKATDLFWKQGFAATSVQDLVSHLGINRASLYDTFGDKEKLFKKSGRDGCCKISVIRCCADFFASLVITKR